MTYKYDLKFLSDWLYERFINHSYNWIYIVKNYNTITLVVNQDSFDDTIMYFKILNKIQITPLILSLINKKDFSFLDIAIKQTLNNLRKMEFEKDFM